MKKAKKPEIDIQYMDMNFDSYYLVPEKDIPLFEDMDGAEDYLIKVEVEGKPALLIDPLLFDEE